jgi:hypothetical protein
MTGWAVGMTQRKSFYDFLIIKWKTGYERFNTVEGGLVKRGKIAP